MSKEVAELTKVLEQCDKTDPQEIATFIYDSEWRKDRDWQIRSEAAIDTLRATGKNLAELLEDTTPFEPDTAEQGIIISILSLQILADKLEESNGKD